MVSLNNCPIPYEEMNRMNRALSFHGSNSGNIWLEKNVGLGQRLVCITPEDQFENQPTFSKDRNFVFVSDGLIHNRPELTQTLRIPIHEAKKMGDSEFIARAYEKWGEECTKHLIGSFAFALWDIKKRSLFMSCAPTLATKPIFYYSSPQIFIFATMPKALLTFPFIKKEMDLNHLADFLSRTPRELGSTFYKSIKLLNGGHSLSLQNSQLKIKSFYNLNNIQELRFPQDEDYMEAFNELFERVISDNLRSITPIGVSMSGGLDSTSIAATASLLLSKENKRLSSFTEVPHKGFKEINSKYHHSNEIPYVQAMGRIYPNLDLNFIRTDGTIFLDDLDTFFDAAEMPFMNTSNRVWIESIFKQAQEQNIRVLLSGVGGNLTMSWDGKGLLSYLFRKGKWLSLFSQACHIGRENSQSTAHVLTSQLLFRVLPLSFKRNALKIVQKEDPILKLAHPWRAYSPILPEFFRAQRVEERARKKNHDFYFISRPFNFCHWRQSKLTPLLQSYPNYFSGYQALFGIEERFPAYDSRIVEFCLSLPEDQFMRKGDSRSFIKRAMKDKLPQEILQNTKRGLQSADYLERLYQARVRILNEIKIMEKYKFIQSVIDLKRMMRLAENISLANRDQIQIRYDYMDVLQMGLMAGKFLLWFEKGNSDPLDANPLES